MKSTSKKILIIEDEKPLARALELKLTHEGYEVKTLTNGEGIMPVLEEDHFSLIVCDLVMPKVDGFQVVKNIKDNKIDVPIIILTNLSQTEDEKRMRDIILSKQIKLSAKLSIKLKKDLDKIGQNKMREFSLL